MSEKLRIYTDGIFDLCHYGHGNVFKQIKEHFKNCHIVVGVMNDEDCHKYKGPTVMSNDERVKCLEYNKYVDEIIPNAPWLITEEFLEKNKIDYCAYHDSGIYNSNIDGHIIPKNKNIFFQIKYTDGISTTLLINRILKNQNIFFERNNKKV